MSEGADRGGNCGKAVAPSGRKAADQIEKLNWIGSARDDFGGSCAAEKIGKQRDSAANHRRIGVRKKNTALVNQFGG